MAIKAARAANSLRYNGRMSWIFLSPHFDDVALSCGGLVWELTQAGSRVSIWTVCAGQPADEELSPFAQALQARWGVSQNAPAVRKIEDQQSCERLGAAPRSFSVPDCIYRRDPQTQECMYSSEAALNGDLQPGDHKLIPALREEINGALEDEELLVCPLGLGKHVDHQLTRMVAEGLNRPLWYYADFPYVLTHRDDLGLLESAGWASQVFKISREGLAAWTDSIAAHASQISTFWPNTNDMKQVLSDYLQQEGGVRLWKKS
jgi:LmbE family N-acetylglucosaminyl deacetylase